jgi:hypothetical protein
MPASTPQTMPGRSRKGRDTDTAPDQLHVGAPPTTTPTTRTRRRHWPNVAATAVVLVGVSLATPAGRHQWALSFIRQPTPYTTLAFADAAHLPTTLPSGGRLDLMFTVANHEGHVVRYRYVVTSASNAQTPVVLRSHNLVVPNGVTKTEVVRVVPRCDSSPCRVQVSLPGPAETIDVRVQLHHPSS